MKSWMEMLAVVMAYLGSIVLGLTLMLAIFGPPESSTDRVGAQWHLANAMFFVGGSVMAGLGGILWVLLRMSEGTSAAKRDA